MCLEAVVETKLEREANDRQEGDAQQDNQQFKEEPLFRGPFCEGPSFALRTMRDAVSLLASDLCCYHTWLPFFLSDAVVPCFMSLCSPESCTLASPCSGRIL